MGPSIAALMTALLAAADFGNDEIGILVDGKSCVEAVARIGHGLKIQVSRPAPAASDIDFAKRTVKSSAGRGRLNR